ncbi:universal stress protein PHOS34-like isoform X1 [Gigantopelta aegis]|uniref:universal stress protein PHOS34-like isoform X1 n=1 Tax=Gigantopelta aegis TaxID=1735272 RepID=UPI001B889B87|nr:universal stress protein PHOS34-like isoform X1 [Gigantopelta aegis]
MEVNKLKRHLIICWIFIELRTSCHKTPNNLIKDVKGTIKDDSDALDIVYKAGTDAIILIHCSDFQVSIGLPGAFSKVDEICAQMKKKEDEISSLISKYTQVLREKGIPGRVCKCGGKPGEEIIKACTTENVSQLVMGTRGLGTIRRTFLGSVSEYCIHHTNIPITIVPVK